MRSSREEQSYAHGGEYNSSGSSSGGSVAGRVLIIIIVCAFIYFISAGAAGKWIAQNIVTPVLSIFDQGNAAPTSTVGTLPNASAAASGNTAQASQKILLPDFSLYCLQIGAFNEQKNADDTAKEAQGRGGAGYILTDGTMRVLLSAYKNEADEKSVASNLTTTASYQTYEYVLSAKGVTFNITAQQNNIDTIKNFFTQAQTVHDAYYDLSTAFDSKTSTAQQITDKISQMKAQMDPLVLSIDNMAQSGDNVLKNMKTLADGLQQVLSTDLTGKSDVEISSQLKYNYIWISDLYRKFVSQIQ